MKLGVAVQPRNSDIFENFDMGTLVFIRDFYGKQQ